MRVKQGSYIRGQKTVPFRLRMNNGRSVFRSTEPRASAYGASLEKARNYAFLLLKFRLRSEKELYERLKRKKFDPEIIKDTLSFLKDKAFIDDKIFAKAWIESRLKRPLGLKRIKQELILKGVDKDIIDSQISEIRNNYPEEKIISQIARLRFDRLKNIDPGIAKRRVYAYLLRRGFSPEAVAEAINQW